MTDVPDLVHSRAPVLRAIRDGAETKPEITDATEHARSTVDRAVDELLEADLLERTGGHYHLTSAAVRILDSYEAFLHEAGIYYERREEIASIPRDAELPVEVLDGAQIATPDPDMPDRALEVALQLVEGADKIYGLVPWMFSIYDRFYNTAVLDHGLEIDVVYTPGVVDHIAELYHDRFQDLLDSGLVDAYVVDELPRYTVSVVEGLEEEGVDARLHVQYIRENEIQSVILNDSDDAVEWGRELYQEYQERAEPIDRYWE